VRRDQWLKTGDELRRFWTEAGHEHPTMAALLRLQLLTGQRGGEVMRMAWSEVDLEGGWWTLPADRSKNKLPHSSPW
jgi:integrase